MYPTVEQFARHVSQGLGRPYQYLHLDSARYQAALLHACLVDPVYDRAVEGPRTTYLLGLIARTGQQQWFATQILAAFAASVNDDALDLPQLFAFAGTFAEAGDQRARDLMISQFVIHADAQAVGAHELIDLDGRAGFRVVAARLGELARDELDIWDSDEIINQLKRVDPSVTDDDLAAMGAADPRIQRYLDTVAETIARQSTRLMTRTLIDNWAYADLKSALLRNVRSLSLSALRRWGTVASDADFANAAHDLVAHTDPHVLAAYLAIFARRPFPLGFAPLIPLVRHAHDGVARRSIHALSHFADPTIHQLGHALLHERWHTGDALALFARTYQPGDEETCGVLIETAVDDDELHHVCMGLLDLLETTAVQGVLELLCLIYKRTPCSMCRRHAVQQLADRHTLPAGMAHECLHDANDDTRRGAAAYLAGAATAG